jgi:hypothetical protein
MSGPAKSMNSSTMFLPKSDQGLVADKFPEGSLEQWIERGVRNVSLLNIEKVARGPKTSLPELFTRI